MKNFASVLQRLSGFAVRLCAIGLLGGAGVAAQAENLVGLRSGELAAVPARVNSLVVVDGKPLAIGADTNWLYDAEHKTWSQLGASMGGTVVGVAADAHQAYALLAPQAGAAAKQIVRLTIAGGALVPVALPTLPIALHGAQAAVLGSMLYLAGQDGDGHGQLYTLDQAAVQPVWSQQAGWSGSAEITSMTGQNSGLFLTLKSPGAGDRMLRWSADKGWTDKPALHGSVLPGSARASGQGHILYLLQNGGATQMSSFHTTTGSSALLGSPLALAPTLAAGWQNGILWVHATEQGSAFSLLEVESSNILLQWLDWVVIVVYLGAMLGMGFYFYAREKRNSTADFFVGGRSIPFWAAGISLYATNTSSISYIAIPAKSFDTNWQYLTNNLVAVFGLMFVAVWIVPLLRRLNLMSVFHYLEVRFHPVIRMLASALCIAVQIGSRLSVILYLPSLAIATITGIDVTYSILMMGGFTMVYTAMGGMKAVIWTDFVQLFVKMGGAVFAIGFIIWKLEGGFGEFLATAAAEDKMKLFDWSFDLTKATVWGFIFLVLFDVILTFPKDQVLMQRVLSTKSAKDASRSVWMFAAIMIPGGFVFYTIGTALFVFYKSHPERMNPLLSLDATFPLFIAAELPMGIRGLIIAGIFAAAMATLSSIMNSVATLASVDFYEKLVKNPNAKSSVRFAEAMTVLTGLVGIGAALMLSRYDIHSLFDISIELAGVLGGGFAGAYTLGMFTRRANWQGVTVGVCVSIILTTIAWSMKMVHPYFYLAISIFICIVVGYLASWLFPAPSDASLAGLTIKVPKVGAVEVEA